VLAALADLAGRRGQSPARLALAWLMGGPGVTAPIVGATRVGHLEDAIEAVGLRLAADERAAVEAPYRPQPIRGHE
jgi:aryl-alcohol dehydrogenase-like predicted oxidoreductase